MDGFDVAEIKRISDGADRILSRHKGDKPEPQPSIARAITSLAAGRLDGFEGEVCEEWCRKHGVDYDAMRPPAIPLLTRSTPISVTSGSGPYLTETTISAEVSQLLRPYDPVLAAGAQIRTGLKMNETEAKVSGDVSGYWVSENSNVPETEPSLSQLSWVYHLGGAFTKFSRQLLLQAPNTPDVLEVTLLRRTAQLLASAALNVGAAASPSGLLGMSNLATQSGTGYTHPNSLTTLGTLAAANVLDANVSWIGATGVRTTLGARGRSAAAGDGFVWQNDQILNRPAQATTLLPAGSLIAGAFNSIVYGFFGPALTLEVTPYASGNDFANGTLNTRLLVAFDVNIIQPTAFVSVQGVT